MGREASPEPITASTQSKRLGEWCKQITPRLPKITYAECRNSRLIPSGANSLNAIPLMSRDFHADGRRKPALRILLIGGIHGDEQTASAIVFKWLELMHKSAAQEFDWKVAPLINPDGLLAKKPKRVNANGIDLNRNFPTPNWEAEAPQYWEKKTKSDPRRFPGKQPISEPESRWVFETIKSYQPHVIISVHAPFGVLDLDGPAKPPKRFGRLLFNRVGVYPGSLGNYSGMHQAIPVLTIELPNALKMPVDAEVVRIWQDMQTWIRNNLPVKKASKQNIS
ncbi:MAG: DUF2817 domain-containing protein [Undibacterium sp.]|nr:DUF2817 domain-containing protein [Undibacterium sp.]